jgi:hypothetical protein
MALHIFLTALLLVPAICESCTVIFEHQKSKFDCETSVADVKKTLGIPEDHQVFYHHEFSIHETQSLAEAQRVMTLTSRPQKRSLRSGAREVRVEAPGTPSKTKVRHPQFETEIPAPTAKASSNKIQASRGGSRQVTYDASETPAKNADNKPIWSVPIYVYKDKNSYISDTFTYPSDTTIGYILKQDKIKKDLGATKLRLRNSSEELSTNATLGDLWSKAKDKSKDFIEFDIVR